MSLYDKLGDVYERRTFERSDLPFKVTKMEGIVITPEEGASMRAWVVTIERAPERITLVFDRDGSVMERTDGFSNGSRSLALAFIAWLNEQEAIGGAER